MNRKLLLSVLAALALITAITELRHGKSTLSKSQSYFAISDTAALTTIRIQAAKGDTVILQKIGNKWFANNNTPVRAEMMSALMKTLHDIDKTKNVSNAEARQAASTLETNGFHLEAMANRRKMADYSYCFSGYTCYATITNSNRFFVVSVAGYPQLLDILQIASPAGWRSREVFAVNPDNIFQIIFNDEQKPENSFTICRAGRDFELKSYPIGLKINNINKEKLFRYIGQFKHITYTVDSQLTVKQADSVKRQTPLFTLSVTTADGQEFWCKGFSRQLQPDTPDYDNFYLQLADGNLVIARYFDFDPVMKKCSYFTE
ncbi:MAG: hypothetical protein IKW86_07770 [Salinivirgaceae bacterium]|nr:hypothetical protein [Salinivirgaceae bacterium]